MLKQRIQELKGQLHQASELCQQMHGKLQDSFSSGNTQPLEQVTGPDEDHMNQLEIQISHFSIASLALFQPEAQYLREILAIMQISSTLERIADVQVSTAKRLMLIQDSAEKLSQLPMQEGILEMLKRSAEMLHQAFTSLEERNIDLAKDIFAKDDAVDQLRDMILKELSLRMKAQEVEVDTAIHLINLAQNIERIADFTTHIAKKLVYMINGEFMQHDI